MAFLNMPSLISRSRYGPEDDYWYNPVGVPTIAGVPVDERAALTYLTVFACVTLIAGDVGRLPLNMYRRRKGGGKDSVTDHRLFDIMHNVPNKDTTSFNYREAAQGHLLLWGNHYSFIDRDKTGKVLALWQIPDPGGVKPKRVGNELVYKYDVDGKEVTRRRDQIFHIPGYGFNGLVGLSMINVARQSIGHGMAAETYGSRFFGEGTHPSGILALPAGTNMGDKEAEYRKKVETLYKGLGKSHSMMILSNGEEYKPMNMSMEDAQYLQTRDHQKIEVCGMYHVPPHKIAIHNQNSNYNNLEQENASYVDSCLMHWLVRWEQCISQQLLSQDERRSGLFFEFLVDGLLRGDSAARAEHYNKLFQVGAITPNGIRSKENMNPYDDIPEADEPFVMMNMIPLKDASLAAEPDSVSGPFTPGAQAPGKDDVDEDEKASIRRYFGGNKRSLRSIVVRDRIARRYKPLILDAAQAIVNREAKAIKNKIASRGKETEIVYDFLDDFYKKFPDYIKKKMGPVLKSFMTAISDEALREIGSDDIDVGDEMLDYINAYADRHVRSSLGQMNALLESEKLEDLEARADEWLEKRPDKIADDEAVRASNATYIFVGVAAGLSATWQIRGAKTCPYCQELNGRRVSAGGSFVNTGDKVDPGGDNEPMRIWGMKTHPPLHRGCDCYISLG